MIADDQRGRSAQPNFQNHSPLPVRRISLLSALAVLQPKIISRGCRCQL